jgi:hypothetical protein
MQPDAQEPLETRHVIHVRVRDEYVGYAQELPLCQAGEVAKVKQHRPPGIAEVEVQRGVAERPVDEVGLHKEAHEG